jgi:hypothetical protein
MAAARRRLLDCVSVSYKTQHVAITRARWQDDSLADIYCKSGQEKSGKRAAHARLSRSCYSTRTNATPCFPEPDFMVIRSSDKDYRHLEFLNKEG